MTVPPDLADAYPELARYKHPDPIVGLLPWTPQLVVITRGVDCTSRTNRAFGDRPAGLLQRLNFFIFQG